MKKKIFGFLASAAFILISHSSFAQLNVGVNSATKATTTVNAAAVNNAVSKTVSTTRTATNTAVTKATQVSTTAVTKVNNAKPEPAVKANAGLNTATQVNSSNNNSGNQSNGNGNSENGTSILTSSQTDATVSGNVSTQNTTDAVQETKTKVKDGADKTKEKTKDNVTKVKDKVKDSKADVNISSETKVKADVKKQ